MLTQGAFEKSILIKNLLVTQSCSTLCNPMDCSPPGSSVHGILQERIMEWVAIPFSRSSWPRDRTMCLPHCRQILYHLSHQGSPFISLVLTQNPKYSGCSINIGWIDRWETEAWDLKVSAKSKFTGFLIFKLFILCWGIVDKQCCNSFRKTAKEFCHTYTCIHSPLNSPPI